MDFSKNNKRNKMNNNTSNNLHAAMLQMPGLALAQFPNLPIPSPLEFGCNAQRVVQKPTIARPVHVAKANLKRAVDETIHEMQPPQKRARTSGHYKHDSVFDVLQDKLDCTTLAEYKEAKQNRNEMQQWITKTKLVMEQIEKQLAVAETEVRQWNKKQDDAYATLSAQAIAILEESK